jgi:hypothetical protein
MATWTQPVAARHVAALWPFCVEHAADALERGGHGEISLGDLYRFLVEGRMTLWVVISKQKVVASGITEVVKYPQLKALRIVTLAGEKMSQWFPEFDKVITEEARNIGATRIEASGRRGWARATKAQGYEDAGYIVAKDLTTTTPETPGLSLVVDADLEETG